MRSLFGAPTNMTVWGAYCVWDRSTLQISYCYPEGYTVVGPSNSTTCAMYASGPTNGPPGSIVPPPPMVTMSLPPDAPVINKFKPSPAAPAYQRDEATHCFEFDHAGMPTYVRGTSQGYWYFEGNVVPYPAVSVLSLYANGPDSSEAPIIGTLSLSTPPIT